MIRKIHSKLRRNTCIPVVVAISTFLGAFRLAACQCFRESVILSPVRMSIHEQLTRFLERRLEPSLELLRQMVAINTFTLNRAGVDALGELTARTFAELGFSSEFVPSIDPVFGKHLILIRPGSGDRIVGMISHLDTVFPPAEEERNHFIWRRDGNRAYGPGTIDIKGGTVMMHMVLSALQAIAPATFADATWMLFLNSSEEVLSTDFGQICLNRLGRDALAALVFEAGSEKDGQPALVTSRKGRATFRLYVEGRGAHAGSRHMRGANAIVQISEVIQRVADLTDYKKGITVNVGTVTGGTVVNRVPHSATAEIEMRAFTIEDYQAGKSALLAMNGPGTVRSAEGGHQCKVRIEVQDETPPWPRNSATDRLFELWQKTGTLSGQPIAQEQRGGVSDGNYLWHSVPTLDGLGPYGDNAHCSEQTPDGSKQQEYVDIGSFVPRAAITAQAIMKLVEES